MENGCNLLAGGTAVEEDEEAVWKYMMLERTKSAAIPLLAAKQKVQK